MSEAKSVDADTMGSYIVGGQENAGDAVALYGVARPPIGEEREVVALYGVRPPVVYPIVDIDITNSELESNIATLKAAVKTIKTNWEGVNKTNLTKLTNSWVGDDCAAYIKKVKDMDGQVGNAVEALNLLIETYEKARDQIAEQQSKITSKITSID